MGTLLLELQNQKNRQALTQAKRKPRANRNGHIIRYIAKKTAYNLAYMCIFGRLLACTMGKTASSIYDIPLQIFLLNISNYLR